MRPAAFVEFARIGFVNMLAFRLRYYTGIVTYFINVTIYYFIWQAVFRASPGFAGFDFAQMITYIAVGWIIRSMYFNNVDTELSNDILEGKIVMAMLRPASVQWSYISRAIGEAVFRLLMLTLPCSVVILLVFPVRPPASAMHFAGFVAALTGSVLLVAMLNFIVGTCAVKLKSILGLLRAKFYMQELLSGLLIPIAVFPPKLRAISAWLPFEHIGYTPMMIYLGKVPADQIARVLLLDLFWIVTLAISGKYFWARMSRRLTVHGG
jgi:ABC-2 type transport system permease protein